jgi:diacylglycerol kinase
MVSNMPTNDASSAVVRDRPRLHALLRRWPAALGFAVAALTLCDFDDGREFAIVLLIASVGYLLIAVLERPRATWWVLAGLLVAVIGLRLLNIPAEPVLAVAAVAAMIVGLLRGSLRRRWLPALQAPATMLFGTVAFIAVAVSPQIRSTLVAAGLLAHTAWDIIHLRAGAIVSPSLAEWCAVWTPRSQSGSSSSSGSDQKLCLFRRAQVMQPRFVTVMGGIVVGALSGDCVRVRSSGPSVDGQRVAGVRRRTIGRTRAHRTWPQPRGHRL